MISPGSSTDRMSDSGSDDWGSNPHRDTKHMTMNVRPILTGSALKVMAVVTMVIDHTALFLLADCHEYTTPVLGGYSIVQLMRTVGRLAFPLFCFLLVEGYRHTSCKKRYALYLLAFALVSEIPWDLLQNGTWFSLKSQNVFFSLLLGFAGISIYGYFQKDTYNRIVGLLMVGCLALLGRADYGLNGYLFIIGLYLLRRYRVLSFLPALVLLPTGWAAAAACIPAYLYNDRRGFIQGNRLKYGFYLFYPVHLWLIWLTK